jgi:DNA-binding winged helix-turn-helix (wHTH) protein
VYAWPPLRATQSSPSVVLFYRFGPYEADAARSELRKFGIRVRLERKPWQLLITLLDHAGEVVTRSGLQHSLWGEGVFVDFDTGLNVAVKKLRGALCDSIEGPTYIETIAGEGYRFIAEVERVVATSEWEQSSMPAERDGRSPFPCPGPLADDRQFELGNSTPVPLPARSSARLYWLALSAIIAILSLAIVGFRLHNQRNAHLPAEDWVLVSQFDNRTGEPALDDVASFALKLELSDSQSVKVVPAGRVQELLTLMKKEPGARIDAVVGREICLRDGSIHLLITGRLEKLGTHYLLSILLVDPDTGVSVRGFSEEASSQAAVLSAVRQLSNRVRERLGEALPLVHRDTQRLEPVTTPSLRALRLYSEAATSAVDDAHAEELLRAAVNEDPQFASAYIYLACALVHHGKPREQWLPAAQRALQLADDLPERERYFIRGSYHKLVGDQTEAVSAYETLLSLYPDHSGALNNLYDLTHRKELLYRLAELHPDDFQWNRAAWIKSGAENDISLLNNILALALSTWLLPPCSNLGRCRPRPPPYWSKFTDISIAANWPWPEPRPNG